MMRTLEGQGPKVESILVDPTMLTIDDVKAKLPESCDPQDLVVVGGRSGQVGQDPAYLNQFFLKPADPTVYKP